MKIKLISVLAAILLGTTVAYGADVSISDSSISVSFEGESGTKELSVWITDQNGEPVYADSRISAGKYGFVCFISPDIASGEYNYIIRSKEAVAEQGKIMLSNTDEYGKFMDAVSAAGSAEDIKKALAEFEPALNMDIYDKIDKSVFCDYIYNEKSKAALPSDTTGFNFMLKRLASLTALRQNVDGIIQNGKLTCMGLIGAEDSVLKLYDELNSSGTGNVNTNTVGKSYKDCDDAEEIFKKLVYTNYITNSDITIDEAKAFFTENAKYLGISASGISNDLIRTLMKSHAATPEALKTVYDNAAADNNTSGSGSGGSGGSGGSSSGGVYVPAKADGVYDSTKELFDDLDGYDWAKQAIVALAEQGIVAGRGNGIYAPQDMVKREELVSVIVRLFGYSGEAELAFDDIDNAGWYAPAISAAVSHGIVYGVNESEFGIAENISRQDMAVIVFRALRLEDISLDTDIDGVDFADNADIAGYAAEAVKVLKKNGIINGYPDGSFAPHGNITRAEAAQVMYNIMKLRGNV